MSELIKHECGIVLIRLLKPLEYYQNKYGTWRYGLHKLYLMMEKQRNRGQDGAGVANIKLNMTPGEQYVHRYRSNSSNPIRDIFEEMNVPVVNAEAENPELLKDTEWCKKNIPSCGEVYLGHLRYGTFGNNSIDYVHPFIRENNWKTRNLVVAGNFNLTNVDELFNKLVELGQHPKDYSDTVTVLEKLGHYLDETNQELFRKYKNEGLTNKEISSKIAENLNLGELLEGASKYWDGGYVMAGMLGHGDSFVMRDPWGIRPASYYVDDEIAVIASEKAVIQTVMDVPAESIKEVEPGHAIIMKKDGTVSSNVVRVPKERKSCSFERIYFSRGSDAEIYKERKKLGELLTPAIVDAIDGDVKNTVFSFIPNTAESAFYGMVKGVEDYHINSKISRLKENGLANLSEEEFQSIMQERPRIEKIAIKDAKLRTFITQDQGRDDLVGHVYDVTWGSVEKGKDKMVIIDDSIVRGTTLKQSILRILDRLEPTKIVVVSSAPQIRYPDCYGIDMAKLGDFVAFRAAIELLKETNQEYVIDDVYKKCKAQENLPKEEVVNYVKEIYKPFEYEQVSAKIGELLLPHDIKAEVEIVYQTVDNLHVACPNDKGDWYFTGDYPTHGGNKVVNKSFINFVEGKNTRAY